MAGTDVTLRLLSSAKGTGVETEENVDKSHASGHHDCAMLLLLLLDNMTDRVTARGKKAKEGEYSPLRA